MIGETYGKRHHRPPPVSWLDLRGMHARATGKMVCAPETVAGCRMHVSRLFDVTYPSSFPLEMRP